MTIYLDADNICHMENGEGYRTVETSAFDGRCREYIEGYRYVPAGEAWERNDGTVFSGEAMMPVKPYEVLLEAQTAAVTAERDALLDDMQALIDEVLGGEEDV